MPAITKPNLHFDVSTYTGTGSALSVTNSGSFQPDLVWVKERSGTRDHRLVDSVRGVGKEVYSSLSFAEATDATGLTAFNSNGYSLGSSVGYNANGITQVGWQWKAGGTAVTNTSGTISSQVSANPTAGFSVVTYTGNGTGTPTIGHGLDVAPSMVIAKTRSTANGWLVYHKSLGATQSMILSGTNAASTQADWGNTTPTSTVFYVNGGNNNISAATYVAYCFAPVAGYSAFGSYTGNGSADGPFVYLGFRPRFVLIRSTSNLREWFFVDTARNSFNVANSPLRANSAGAEGTDTVLDMVSNGFKLRSSDTAFNASETYIYAAFAENPFKYANAR